MAPEFVTLTEFYTRLPVAVRVDRVIVVGKVNGVARLELDGVDDDLAVSEPFGAVVARLNGDESDGR